MELFSKFRVSLCALLHRAALAKRLRDLLHDNPDERAKDTAAF
jgi:hypothetical protein